MEAKELLLHFRVFENESPKLPGDPQDLIGVRNGHLLHCEVGGEDA